MSCLVKEKFMDWNAKFNTVEFVYGTEPNDFLRSVADRLPERGNILSLAEGEGRNAVFLAGKGFDVTGVDGSLKGLKKALQLAESKAVKIKTIHSDLRNFKIEKDFWDGIVIIFCHLPPELRRKVFRSAAEGLKPDGVLVFEGYSKEQIKNDTGGPKDPELLYDLEELKSDFRGLEFEIARQIEREIIEGDLHTGRGSVIQILASRFA